MAFYASNFLKKKIKKFICKLSFTISSFAYVKQVLRIIFIFLSPVLESFAGQTEIPALPLLLSAGKQKEWGIVKLISRCPSALASAVIHLSLTLNQTLSHSHNSEDILGQSPDRVVPAKPSQPGSSQPCACCSLLSSSSSSPSSQLTQPVKSPGQLLPLPASSILVNLHPPHLHRPSP